MSFTDLNRNVSEQEDEGESSASAGFRAGSGIDGKGNGTKELDVPTGGGGSVGIHPGRDKGGRSIGGPGLSSRADVPSSGNHAARSLTNQRFYDGTILSTSNLLAKFGEDDKSITIAEVVGPVSSFAGTGRTRGHALSIVFDVDFALTTTHRCLKSD